MSGNKVINRILELERINANQLAESIGVRPTQVYDLISGKVKRVSEKFAEKILTKYSNYSKSWLLTGEGEEIDDLVVGGKKVAGKVEEPAAVYGKSRNDDYLTTKELIETIRYLSETVNSLQKKIEQLESENKKDDIHHKDNSIFDNF